MGKFEKGVQFLGHQRQYRKSGLEFRPGMLGIFPEQEVRIPNTGMVDYIPGRDDCYIIPSTAEFRVEMHANE